MRRNQLRAGERALKYGMHNFQCKLARELIALSANAWKPGSPLNLLPPRTLVDRANFGHLYNEDPDRKLMVLISLKSQLTKCER